jgi:hypothetical protein
MTVSLFTYLHFRKEESVVHIEDTPFDITTTTYLLVGTRQCQVKNACATKQAEFASDLCLQVNALANSPAEQHLGATLPIRCVRTYVKDAYRDGSFYPSLFLIYSCFAVQCSVLCRAGTLGLTPQL